MKTTIEYTNISIIICSRQPSIPQSLQENISATIGVDYEVIVIDNSANQYSIFSAYNEGVRRSSGDVLCFMHEDILMHTPDWGMRVLDHFNADDKLGCIGNVGGHFLPNTISSWFHPRIYSGGCTPRNGIDERDYTRFDGKNTIEVVSVDGLWLCIPKMMFADNLVRWDDITFDGFHCYDLDICLQIREAGYMVKVVSDILIQHFSPGYCNKAWYADTEVFIYKWGGG